MKIIDSLGNETITDTVTISLELNIPSNVTASQGTSETEITINWETNGNLEGTIYVLESSDTADGPWTEIYRGEELTHKDPQEIDVTKYYRIKAVTSKGEETEYSGVISGRTACIHVFTAWTSANSSTHRRTCTKCGEVENGSHTFGVWSTNSSTHSRSCTVCSYTSSGSHSWTGWTITSSATCTSSGSRRRTCTICARTDTETISAFGHSYNRTSSSSPTCTSSGRATYTCSRCGDSYTTTYGSALGHSYSSSWSTDYYNHWKACSRCGDKKDLMSHTWQTIVTGSGTAQRCMVCGYTVGG